MYELRNFAGITLSVIYCDTLTISSEEEPDESLVCAILARTNSYSFSDGTKRIADNTLVALTLMIAESRTEEKDTMVKVIVNLINKNN